MANNGCDMIIPAESRQADNPVVAWVNAGGYFVADKTEMPFNDNAVTL